MGWSCSWVVPESGALCDLYRTQHDSRGHNILLRLRDFCQTIVTILFVFLNGGSSYCKRVALVT